jgi:hypothetical protein
METDPYKNLPSDTPDHIRKIQLDIVMGKTPLERLKMCCDMADFSIAMVRQQIRNKNPDILEGELKYETIKRFTQIVIMKKNSPGSGHISSA